MDVLGIDIGGTGVKGAPADTARGTLKARRCRVATPQPATTAALAAAVADIARHFAWEGPLGCGFPAVIKGGRVLTTVHLDPAWVGENPEQVLGRATGCPARVINDADAAGLAEMRWGAGRGQNGVVLMVTLGTGIGTALFTGGRLLPNTELGHIEIRGRDAERRAAASTRERKDLSWGDWAGRVDEYLLAMERLFWPDLIIVGGGVSRKHHKFLPRLTVKTRVVPAALRNDAGILGAALAATEPPAPDR